MAPLTPAAPPVNEHKARKVNIWRALVKHRALYLLMVPGIAFYIIFKYIPMYGVLIAFQEYRVTRGVWNSEWVGFKHFIHFFYNTPNAWNLIRNTLLLNIYEIIFHFPAPIVLAILLNELKSVIFKRLAQTISYMPHFLSTVVIVGMVVNFLSPQSGIINHMLAALGFERTMFMGDPDWFRTIYISSEIWQKLGWGTILYLAAIAGIDPTLYEAARIDGASRFQQVRHITFVGMVPVIVILFVLNLGNMMEIGYQKIILLYNPLVYETADVINTFVYRRGILRADFSFATAIGLFQSLIGFILVVLANRAARKYTETSLW